jgi:hypothetical protein
VAKKLLYKLMPHPLKLKLLPLEQYLLPDLPAIVGNGDYQTLRAQLLRTPNQNRCFQLVSGNSQPQRARNIKS